MKLSRLAITTIAGAVLLPGGCHECAPNRFDHATKWYEYDFKPGPGIAGFTYSFADNTVVARMFVASLQDGVLHESAEYQYQMTILQKVADGYLVVAPRGRGVVRFDGEDLLLEWDGRGANEPERRLTSAPPNIPELRKQWEAQAGMSVEEFLKDE